MSDSNKPVVVELGIEFVVELLLFLYPYGADQMNLPHNFWLGLACWIGGTAIAIRMLWIFPAWSDRLSARIKIVIIIILLTVFALTFRKPVMTAYHNRNVGENTVLAQDSRSAATPPSQSATANGTNNAAANVNQTGNGNTAVVGNNNKVGNTYNTKAESLTGKLVPGSDPTPDNNCRKGSNDSVLIFLGQEDSHNAVLVDQFPHTVLALGDPRIHLIPVLRLERSTNGELIVDLDIRSHDGKIITRLDKDGFVVNGNK